MITSAQADILRMPSANTDTQLPATRPPWMRGLYWEVALARAKHEPRFDVGQRLGITVAQVRQIEIKVDRMLRGHATEAHRS